MISFFKHQKIKWLFWGTSLLFGVSVASVLCFQLQSFWDLSRTLKLGLFLVIILFGSVTFKLILQMILNLMDHQGKGMMIFLILFSGVAALMMRLLIFRDFSYAVPENWLRGIGIWIEIIAVWICFLFAVPSLIFFVLSILQRYFQFFIVQVPSVSWCNFYPSSLVIIFIIVLLVPAIFSTNLWNIEDSFFGDKALIRIISKCRYFLGDRLYQDVIISEDNWLVFANNISINDYQHPWNVPEEDLKKINRKLNQFNDALAAQDITFMCVIAPNKNTIYPEYFPEEIPLLNEQSRLDQIIAFMESNSHFQILDVREPLLKAKESRQVYYPTDTHWNPYGAYIAYQEIMNVLNKSFPGLKPIPLDNFIYEPMPLRKSGMANNFVHVDIPDDYYNLTPSWDTLIEVRSYDEIDKIEYLNMDSTPCRLLVFHDSFGVALRPFLINHFSYSSFYRGYDIDPFHIEAAKPDIVLVVWTERSLAKLLEIPDL